MTEQARRVVGAAVAVQRGWLPRDFFDVATRADVVLDVAALPLAPPGRLYFAGARCVDNEAKPQAEKRKGGNDRYLAARMRDDRSNWMVFRSN